MNTTQINDYASRYNAGESLEDLALDAGCYPRKIRAILVDAGVEIRSQGGRKGKPNRITRKDTEGKGRNPDARIVRPSAVRGFR